MLLEADGRMGSLSSARVRRAWGSDDPASDAAEPFLSKCGLEYVKSQGR
jgi:hypothetical protein